MKINKKYFAFISYSHKDSEMAKWLQHEFEYYELPSTLFEVRKDIRKEDLPESFKPIFRDEDELSGGDLKPQISEALADSEYLIVVCSPYSAQSKYVNNEINEFISLSPMNKRRIFPFIIDGKPHQTKENKKEECFPKTLLRLSKDKTDKIELIAGDVNATGRDHAFVKILAGTLKEKNISFADLWDRYAVYKAEEERKQREQRDKLLIMQSRFLAEKANDLVEQGDSYTARLLALEALPKDLENPDRPYVIEAEIALREACSCEKRIFKGHCASVSYISISPNGNLIASASQDNTLRLWDLHNGRCISTLYRPRMTTGKFRYEVLDGLIDEIDYIGFKSVEFSPDGKYLIAAGNDATIYLYSVENLECICQWSNHEIYYPFHYATFAPGMKYIVSVGNGELDEVDSQGSSGLMIWNIGNNLPTGMINSFADYEYISYSPDGNYFACVCNRAIEIWDTHSQKYLFTLAQQYDIKKLVYNKGMVKFSPKDQQLAFSFSDMIHIWDYKKRKLLQTLSNHGEGIDCISYTPSGNYIISGGKDKIISIWDIDKGICVQKLVGHSGNINSVAVSLDGLHVLSAGDDNEIRLWSINNNYVNSTVSKENQLTNNKKIEKNNLEENNIYYDEDRNNIYIENLTKVGITYGLTNPHLTPIQSYSLSPDRNQLLTVSYDNNLYLCKNLYILEKIAEEHIKPDQEIYRIEVFPREKQDLLIFEGHADGVRSASFSTDGKYIVSCSEDQSIKIWDVISGRCVQTINENEKYCSHVKFANNNTHIIAYYLDKSTKIWYFPPLQRLINENAELFKNRQLTPEERKKYYLD